MTTLPARLLLIDDDPVVLNTLGQGLKTAGYEVVTASDGRDGLAKYRKRPPDLVVLDLGLPGMSGTELAMAMLAHLYRPIVIVSAHSEAKYVRDAVRTGVMSYLVKPIGARQLIPSIETARARFTDLRSRVAKRWSGALPMAALLDRLAFGLMVLDRDHHIVVQNRAARQVLAECPVLNNRDGRLVAAGACRRRLHAALEQALNRSEAPEISVLAVPGGVLDDLHLLIAPFMDGDGSRDHPAYVIIVITSPHAPTAAPAPILKALYGLTAKESRLAQALLNGDTVETFCATRCVSPNTARTQLKAIYQKTGTHRQSELVRTLAKLFGGVALRSPEDVV